MKTKNAQKNFLLILILYLLGIFMGAIDTGIITPARTVIQNFLSVDDKTGIWMITMYTLAYAASIPVMGKLADKYGRKYIYLVSIFLFGLGSLFCGLSQDFGSFQLLLISRAVQAIGGGGILPVATAEFGTTFPKEKRGMALGLVGAVYGVANIIGSSAGSAILDIFGTDNWQFIFYVNVPITIFILLAGFFALPNSREENVKKIDLVGIFLLTVMILSVLYGLKNIDFFDFTATFTSTSVYPFLIIFVVLLPLFCIAETRAKDPVMNLHYFLNLRIVVTLILSFFTGVIIMGMIFVPQFSENALKIATGKGGYFVFILGIFAGIGAPLSGKLIDKYGVRLILGFGFLISVAGSLYLTLITANHPNLFHVLVSLILVGIGIGFTMGTPINYMMLENTQPQEANSALAAVSLIRSIGTAIAPAVMIGFLAHAGTAVQSNVMSLLPEEVSLPSLPYATELNDTINQLKSNENMKDKLAGVEFPDLSSLQTVKIDMASEDSSVQIPQELIELMQTSDVTNVTDRVKTFSKEMFALMTPDLILNIQEGIQSGITAMESSASDLDTAIARLKAANQTPEAQVTSLTNVKNELSDTIDKMTTLKAAIPDAFQTAQNNYLTEIDKLSPAIEEAFQDTLNIGFQQVYLTVTIVSLLGLFMLLFYRKNKNPQVTQE